MTSLDAATTLALHALQELDADGLVTLYTREDGLPMARLVSA